MVEGLESENSNLNLENSELIKKLQENMPAVSPSGILLVPSLPPNYKPAGSEVMNTIASQGSAIHAEEVTLTRLNPTS